MNVDPEAILNFWFGDRLDDPEELRLRAKLWFRADTKFDAEIRRRFESAVYAAAQGELQDLPRTARNTLAVILLLDQFPRNIFRGTARAFAFDSQAVDYCLDGLARKRDLQLNTVERAFFYLPLEHAETLEAQTECVAQFQTLHAAATADLVEFTRNNLAYAQEHYALIERFGRFPHRNEVLQRVSTQDELAFLADQGKHFGQG